MPKMGLEKAAGGGERKSKEVGVHDGLNTSEVSSREASFQLVYLLACFAVSKRKQLKKKSRLVLKQSLSVTFPPQLSVASATAICHRLSGNRAASTLFHLSVAKLLLFSGGQRTHFAPLKSADRGWGAGTGAGPRVHSARKGPLQGEVPTSIIGSVWLGLESPETRSPTASPEPGRA